MKDGRWIRFEQMPDLMGRKTQRWIVRARLDNAALGVVQWDAPWRKYSFFPRTGTAFEQDCLADLSRFVADVTEAYRQQRRQEHAHATTAR